MKVAGSDIQYNTAKAGGSSIFYVSNDKTGRLIIDSTISKNNTYAAPGYPGSHSFQTYPGIFFIGSSATFTNSVIQ